MSECACWPTSPELWRCEHYHFFKGGRKLTGITTLIREAWPVKPDYSKADPAVLENARERGAEVDDLFSAWIAGTMKAIPAGTREDSVELFQKLLDFVGGMAIEDMAAQVVLSDAEHVGIIDILADGCVYDLKTTYNLEPSYSFQVGGYCHLYEAEHGRFPEACGIIHLTKRQPVKLVNFEVSTVVSEFRLLKEFYGMVKRKTAAR